MIIKKFIGGTIFGIGCTLCVIGGCALDSELLIIPLGLILTGIGFGFLGYCMMEINDDQSNMLS